MWGWKGRGRGGGGGGYLSTEIDSICQGWKEAGSLVAKPGIPRGQHPMHTLSPYS